MEKVWKDSEITGYVNWLHDTLIPDLVESGRENTAEDFVQCCEIIEQLQKELSNERAKSDRARRLGTSPEF